MKVESGIEQERGGDEVEGGGGQKEKKREDLEKRVAFRNKLNERERKRKGGGVGGGSERVKER